MKISFIGSGKMAEALISGITESHTLSPNSINCTDRDDNKSTYLNKKYKINKYTNNLDAIKKTRVLNQFNWDKAPSANNKSGCFVATTVYGDYNAKEVISLRIYRDEVLSKSQLGKIFISNYYCFLGSYFKLWLFLIEVIYFYL